MIDKFMRRFCAQEIQILLKKIEDDYTDALENRVWLNLADDSYSMTRVEQFCVRRTMRKARKAHRRQQFLAAILKQQLNPQKDSDDTPQYIGPSLTDLMEQQKQQRVQASLFQAQMATNAFGASQNNAARNAVTNQYNTQGFQ